MSEAVEVAVKAMQKQLFMLPAKSMSWRSDTPDEKSGATMCFNGRPHGRVVWNEATLSWDASVKVRMRKAEGQVDEICAAVTGLSTKNEAGGACTKQWFRIAWKFGWYAA